MGVNENQTLIVYTRKNFKKKEKKENLHHNKKRTRSRRRPKEIFQIFDVIPVMKRDTWKWIVPSRKEDTMLIMLNMMNQQTKDSNERMMIQMNNMC